MEKPPCSHRGDEGAVGSGKEEGVALLNASTVAFFEVVNTRGDREVEDWMQHEGGMGVERRLPRFYNR